MPLYPQSMPVVVVSNTFFVPFSFSRLLFILGSNCSKNQPQDLFITQESTLSYLLPYLQKLSKNITIYDPCCGTYAIGNFLRDHGYNNIIETDLYTTPIKTDFLKTKIAKCDLMIANIPFCIKYQFFKKAYLSGKQLFFFSSYLFNFFMYRIPLYLFMYSGCHGTKKTICTLHEVWSFCSLHRWFYFIY